MMTRKDYKRFAEVIADAYRSTESLDEHRTIARISHGLTAVFGANNPRFDRNKWSEYISKLLSN